MAAEQPRFSIPEQELPSLKSLVRMTPEILQTLAEALKKQAPVLSMDRLSKPISQDSGIEESVIVELLPLIWRWTMLQRRLEMNVQDFVASLSIGLDKLSEEEWSTDDKSRWYSICDQLQKLLSSDNAIALSAKASELLLDQNLILCSSRVITDTRMVFDDSADVIKGILPYHTLVLRCHEGNDDKTFYIALDTDDLSRLKGQIERAEQKEKLVNSAFRDAGMTVIETSVRAID